MLKQNIHHSSSRVRAVRDDSPDSVILFTQDSSFFSSTSCSVERCSFASDVHDHEHQSFVSELSKHLSGSECLSGPDLDVNNRGIVQKKRHHTTKVSDKVKDCKEEEEEEEEEEDDGEETEDDNQNLDSARNSFSRAIRECQNRRFKSEVHAGVKKQDRRRPASLDLNNPKSNAIATGSSPRFGGMKKSSVTSRKCGAFPSPGTPNYWQGSTGVQKGWSSERVPLPQNSGRRNVGTALLPFSSGRTLPSKWEDAEKWIFSPVSGDGLNRASVPLPQRRPKSKSGPLGPPGVAYYATYSPCMPMFDGGNSYMEGSPFSAGALAANRLPGNGQHSVGCRDGGSYPAHTEPGITRSASVHGWSSERLSQSLPDSQDEKFDGIKDASTVISRAVSRRDMATQMSPDGSPHSSPKGSLSFSSSPPPSFLPILELNGCHSSKLEVRDVQVDDRVTMTRWSKKHGARGPERGFTNIGDWRKRSVETRASTWETSEATKCMAKSNREEAKITAWENLQKAKAEAAIRKLEMKLEKKRSSSMDKIMNKLRLAQKKAQDMRSSVLVSQTNQVAKTSNRIVFFRKHTQISSLSGCFTCHAF